ncbi:protein EOLA1-like [Glandiceps talaboti]
MPKSKRKKYGQHGTRNIQQENEDNGVESKLPTQTFPCISARQPYAGFILDGLKTVETRWTQIFKNLENQKVAIQIAWNEWEGTEWKDILMEKGMEEVEISEVLENGKRHGKGVIAGIFTVGESWQYESQSVSEDEKQDLERQAILRPLDEKYLTRIHNPKWLLKPLTCRGQRGVWKVDIPENILPS